MRHPFGGSDPGLGRLTACYGSRSRRHPALPPTLRAMVKAGKLEPCRVAITDLVGRQTTTFGYRIASTD